MPTVARIDGYRFFFYSKEGSEPPHIHVRRERLLAKFWIDPVTLARSTGFAAHELARIEAIITRNQGMFLEAWNAFFNRD